jgi:hypothetical protein
MGTDDSSGIQDVEDQFGDALGSLLTILAHSEEGGPVPGVKKRKKGKPGEVKLAGG